MKRAEQLLSTPKDNEKPEVHEAIEGDTTELHLAFERLVAALGAEAMYDNGRSSGNGNEGGEGEGGGGPPPPYA